MRRLIVALALVVAVSLAPSFSVRAQTVTIASQPFLFHEGETIHTEISCKYSIEEFQSLAKLAGLEARDVWTDSAKLFSVHYLTVPSDGK